jgi:hypothetical protein
VDCRHGVTSKRATRDAWACFSGASTTSNKASHRDPSPALAPVSAQDGNSSGLYGGGRLSAATSQEDGLQFG